MNRIVRYRVFGVRSTHIESTDSPEKLQMLNLSHKLKKVKHLIPKDIYRHAVMKGDLDLHIQSAIAPNHLLGGIKKPCYISASYR